MERVPDTYPGIDSDAMLNQMRNIHIVTCKTNYNAEQIARYWLELLIGVPRQVEIASEYRYRRTAVPDDTTQVIIFQSGETAKTLAAFHQTSTMSDIASLAICNVAGSSLARESEYCLSTNAGFEIEAAFTKVLTSQLLAFLLLIVGLAKRKQFLSPKVSKSFIEINPRQDSWRKRWNLIPRYRLWQDKWGREISPSAAESVCKLKELSYSHVESHANCELRHSLLILVDGS